MLYNKLLCSLANAVLTLLLLPTGYKDSTSERFRARRKREKKRTTSLKNLSLSYQRNVKIYPLAKETREKESSPVINLSMRARLIKTTSSSVVLYRNKVTCTYLTSLATEACCLVITFFHFSFLFSGHVYIIDFVEREILWKIQFDRIKWKGGWNCLCKLENSFNSVDKSFDL